MMGSSSDRKVRAAAVLLCLGIGGSYWAWHVLAAAVDSKTQNNPGPAVEKTHVSSRWQRTDRYGDSLPTGAAMRLGTVRFRQTLFVKHIAYSPDGQFVVTHNEHRHLQIWDARDGRKLREIDAGIESIRDFAISPDGKLIAAAGFHSEPERNLLRRFEWDVFREGLSTLWDQIGQSVDDPEL